MRLELILCLLLSSIPSVSFSENSKPPFDPGVRLSLVNLIATPEIYHGKLVVVSGYAFIELENNNLCLTKEPASAKDCVWINYDDGPFETDEDLDRFEAKERDWLRYHRKSISIRGIFDANGSGHLGGSSGEIGHIVDVNSHN